MQSRYADFHHQTWTSHIRALPPRPTIKNLVCLVFLLLSSYFRAVFQCHPASFKLCLFLKCFPRGTWLARSVDHLTLDLRDVSLSPTMGIEITFLKNEITCFLSLNTPLSLPHHHLPLLFLMYVRCWLRSCDWMLSLLFNPTSRVLYPVFV